MRTQRIRLWWVALTFLAGVATAMMAEELILLAQGNQLNFKAPGVHYLSGRPFERMKNAEEVRFDFLVTLMAGTRGKILKQKAGQFRISYDVIEERFKIVQLLPTRKTVSRLSASEAERWCVQEMSGIDISGVPPTQPLWASMEIRAEKERDRNVFTNSIDEDGISLKGIIEVFSRKAEKAEPRWLLESGPVTLEQARRGG